MKPSTVTAESEVRRIFTIYGLPVIMFHVFINKERKLLMNFKSTLKYINSSEGKDLHAQKIEVDGKRTKLVNTTPHSTNGDSPNDI